jgi:hypothetical protein
MVESRKPADSLLLIDPADPAKPVFPARPLHLYILLRFAGETAICDMKQKWHSAASMRPQFLRGILLPSSFAACTPVYSLRALASLRDNLAVLSCARHAD